MKLSDFSTITWKVNSNLLESDVDILTEKDTGKTVLPNIDVIQYDKFGDCAVQPICVNIDFSAINCNNGNEEKVGVVELVLVRSDLDFNCAFSLMDSEDALCGDAVCDLYKSKEFKTVGQRLLGSNIGCVGVMETCFVYPEFRQQGIFKWISENLNSILSTALHMEVSVLITELLPFKEDDFEEYIPFSKDEYAEYISVDENSPMKTIMEDVFKKDGWRRTKNGYYIKALETFEC